MASAEPRRRHDGAGDIRFRQANRVNERRTQCQACGNGRREGATSAVSVRRLDSLPSQLDQFASVIEHVDRRAAKVTAFDDNGAGTITHQPARGVAGICYRLDVEAGQGLDLRKIRGDQVSERDEALSQCHQSFVVEQSCPRGRGHDCVEHDGAEGMPHNCSCDCHRDGRCRQHPNLGGRNPEVRHDRVDLCDYDIHRYRQDRLNTQRVLRGHSGNGAEPVDLMCGERFQVGLDTGAGARIAPANCQRRWHFVRIPSVPISAPTLLDWSLRESSLATPSRVAAVALATALTSVAAQFTWPAPFTVVPFTLTPLAVVLTGAALGARLGSLAQVLYVMLGAAGMAVFAPSATLPPGMLRLVGPTGGYLLAYPLAAYVVGYLAERGWGRRYATSFGAMLAGLVVIYAGGVSWLAVAYTHSLTAALTMGLAQFVLLDVAKAVVAAMLLPQAWRLVGPAKDR